METIVLVVHLLVALALIGVILLQKTASDGGGLMGGGTMGGLFTARGSANVLTRTTAILATIFVCTSLTLAFIAAHKHKSSASPLSSISIPAETAPTPNPAPVAPSVPLGQ